MIDPLVAYEKIADFKTSEEVANFFVGAEIRAEPGNDKLCAISQWMISTTRLVTVTSVNGIKLIKDGVKYAFPLTPALTSFIYQFDAGAYPELISEES